MMGLWNLTGQLKWPIDGVWKISFFYWFAGRGHMVWSTWTFAYLCVKYTWWSLLSTNSQQINKPMWMSYVNGFLRWTCLKKFISVEGVCQYNDLCTVLAPIYRSKKYRYCDTPFQFGRPLDLSKDWTIGDSCHCWASMYYVYDLWVLCTVLFILEELKF